jgi:MFS family permease
MGMSLLAIGLPLSFFIKNKPEQHASESGYQFTLIEALKNSSFWLLAIAMAISSLTLLAQPRLLIAAFVPPQQFINFTTILTLSSIAGVLLFGFMGDTFPKRFLLSVAAISLGIGSSISLVIAGSWQVYLYVVFFGLGYGLYPLMFAIRADYFGIENFATISAVMIAIIEIGFVGIVFAISPLAFIQHEPDLTILSIVLSFIAAILFYFAKSPAFREIKD